MTLRGRMTLSHHHAFVAMLSVLERINLDGSNDDCVSAAEGDAVKAQAQVLVATMPALMRAKRTFDKRVVAGACRLCGCTDDRACPGGCYWVFPNVCSACAPEEPET